MIESLRDARKCFMKRYVSEALVAARGNVAQAARLAGVHRVYFWTLIKKYNKRGA